MSKQPEDWWIYQGKEPQRALQTLLQEGPPPWRKFKRTMPPMFEPNRHTIRMVNAALHLRRPLLVTGKPGTGKTSLAYAVAKALQLGDVLRWSITTQTTLKDGLYHYDAIARLQDASLQAQVPEQTRQIPNITKYLRLGPLGTAFADTKLRVLLIDEIDKSDIDLPNDLLHIFEEGAFEIPELLRLPDAERKKKEVRPSDSSDGMLVRDGNVSCTYFPLVIMTSNGEREFPPAFLRRCLQLEIQPPRRQKLERIVAGHLGELGLTLKDSQIQNLISAFLHQQTEHDLATDQLLNALYLVLKQVPLEADADSFDTRSAAIDAEEESDVPEHDPLLNALWQSLSAE